MIYCVNIRDYYSGKTIKTILETTNYDEACATANSWNNEHNVTEDDIDSFYKEYVVVHSDGHICQKLADVYQDETR